MQPATMPRVCGLCESLGKQCENCENDALHRDAEEPSADADMESVVAKEAVVKARSKSPLVNSAERNSKWAKVDSSEPLAPVPSFPSIISGEKCKGEKGKEGEGKGDKGKRQNGEGGGDGSGGGGENDGGGIGEGAWGQEKERTHGVEAAGEGKGRTRGAGSEGIRGTR